MREQFEAWYVSEYQKQGMQGASVERAFAWKGYQVGHAAARAEAEALLREIREGISDLNPPITAREQNLLAKIDAYLLRGKT